MNMPTKQKSDYVAARAACVVTCDARPIEYGKVTVRSNKTGELVTIDNQNEIVDPGDEGISYVFRPYQKVHKNHPAVLASPSTFIPLDEVDQDINPIVEA
jgi:hypothetical protein